jgi:hypothetical protein
VGLSATVYDCGNARSRMYFGWWWDGTGIPFAIDAITPVYQWQMIRTTGQTQAYHNGELMSFDPGTQAASGTHELDDLPYQEMAPPPDHAAGIRMKEARVVVGFDDAGAIGASHTLKVPMRYADHLHQP